MTADIMKIKLCLLGDSMVGKTSLIGRYVHDIFDDKYLITIGAKTSKKTLFISHPSEPGRNLEVVFMINDIMGQYNYTNMMESYMQGAQGGILVCDLTRESSLYHIDNWIDYVESIVGKVPIIVVGNKADLEDQFEFTPKDLEKFTKRYQVPTVISSAKTGENVEHLFKEMAKWCTSFILTPELNKELKNK